MLKSCDLDDDYGGVVDIIENIRYYTIYRYISDLLAQLGEHYLDRVGVSGSSPLQIIAKSPCIARAFF